MRLFVLSLASALLLAGCGGIRRQLAEEAYLQQQLYDYSYGVPLELLWTEARAVTGAQGEGALSEGGVRTLSLPGLLLRGWEADGRSHLHILRVHDANQAPRPEDAGARAVDLELKLLERFHPEDARRFQDGAHRAGERVQ